MINNKDVESDVAKLKEWSQAIDNGNISEFDFDAVYELMDKFKYSDKSEVREYFNSYLNDKESDVFVTYHSNLEQFNKVLVSLCSLEASNDDLRRYFFGNKYTSKLLFTDQYRSILDYIQREVDLKVKTELFFDLHSYFKYGCYDVDKYLSPLKEAIDSKNDEEINKAIIEMNSNRNISVKAISKGIYVGAKIGATTNYKNKSGTAKSGFFDCVKKVPLDDGRNYVVVMGTADGKLQLKPETDELSRHIACIEVENRMEDIYSSVWCCESKALNIVGYDYYMLTEFKSDKISKEVQKEFIEHNLNIERLRFISDCYLPVIKNPLIGNSPRRLISMHGICCKDATSDEINNLDVFIQNELENIVEKRDVIEKMFDCKNSYVYIKEYFQNLSNILINGSDRLNIRNHKEICELLWIIPNEFFPEKNQELLLDNIQNQIKNLILKQTLIT